MGRKKVKSQACRVPDEKRKIPRVNERQVTDKPSWRFSSVDTDGPFAWPKGGAKEADIVSKLHNFDSMKWSDIEGDRHHTIKKESLSKEAIKRLEAIGQDDVDEVFSFALGGRPRIICLRNDGIARLLWFDPDHKVCPSKLKNT
jgi:hypothetical protein